MQSVLQSQPAGNPAPAQEAVDRLPTITEGQAGTAERLGQGDELGVLTFCPQPGLGSLGFRQVGMAADNGSGARTWAFCLFSVLFLFFWLFGTGFLCVALAFLELRPSLECCDYSVCHH